MDGLIYLNGELIDAKTARVSALDAGMSHGAGLFETIRAYRGQPFRIDMHLARLKQSAAALGVPLPWTNEQLRAAVDVAIRANELQDARLRLVITPGPPPDDADSYSVPTIMVFAGKFQPYPPETYQKGMTVCICPYKISPTDPLAGHKTLSYFPRILALRDAQRKHCAEALWFTTENRLAEGCVSNIFLVRGPTLLTPPLETPVLPGIARQVVLECSAASRLTIQQQPLTIEDLLAADEVFLTNTQMEVMPVCRIERHRVGDEKVGEVTRQLHEAYRDVVRSECQLGP